MTFNELEEVGKQSWKRGRVEGRAEMPVRMMDATEQATARNAR